MGFVFALGKPWLWVLNHRRTYEKNISPQSAGPAHIYLCFVFVSYNELYISIIAQNKNFRKRRIGLAEIHYFNKVAFSV